MSLTSVVPFLNSMTTINSRIGEQNQRLRRTLTKLTEGNDRHNALRMCVGCYTVSYFPPNAIPDSVSIKKPVSLHLEDSEGNIDVRQDKQLKIVEGHWSNLYSKHKEETGSLVEEAEQVGENRDQPEHLDEEEEDILDVPITVEEVEKAVKDLGRGKAMGKDDIPGEFLKEGGEVLYEWISEFLNQVVEQEKIPEGWKKGIVTMIHKGGRKEEVGNYRGITVNDSIYKVFTRILTNRWEEEVEKRGLLGEIQFGFRRERNTIDAAFILRQIFDQGKKANKKYVVAFLDVRKAYDRVWSKGLWMKLEELGFGGRFLRILKELYKDSGARVRVGNNETDLIYMEEGLRQGCSLSPMLFAIYLKGLGDELVASGLGVKMGNTNIPGLFFADDMAIIGENDIQLQELLNITGRYGRK